jgi:hypothetical protein
VPSFQEYRLATIAHVAGANAVPSKVWPVHAVNPHHAFVYRPVYIARVLGGWIEIGFDCSDRAKNPRVDIVKSGCVVETVGRRRDRGKKRQHQGGTGGERWMYVVVGEHCFFERELNALFLELGLDDIGRDVARRLAVVREENGRCASNALLLLQRGVALEWGFATPYRRCR